MDDLTKDCKFCEGTGFIGGAAINDRCDDCKGTGKDYAGLTATTKRGTIILFILGAIAILCAIGGFGIMIAIEMGYLK